MDRDRWIPISAWGRSGEYQVIDDYVVVRIGSLTARAAASSARVPAALGTEADKMLAETLLGEIVPEERKPTP